jgi:hypothetical protein
MLSLVVVVVDMVFECFFFGTGCTSLLLFLSFIGANSFLNW